MTTEEGSLRSLARLKEWRFTSHLPFVGGLISATRNSIFSLASRWPVRFALQQQSEFNERLLDLIEDARQELRAELGEQTQRVTALQSALEKANCHILNLERQAIENDRAIIRISREVASLKLAAATSGQEPHSGPEHDHQVPGITSMVRVTQDLSSHQ